MAATRANAKNNITKPPIPGNDPDIATAKKAKAQKTATPKQPRGKKKPSRTRIDNNRYSVDL